MIHHGHEACEIINSKYTTNMRTANPTLKDENGRYYSSKRAWDKYYSRNKDFVAARSNAPEQIENRKKRAQRHRDYINRVKSTCPCVDCGRYYNPWQMDFDHVRGEKKFILAAGSNLGYSMKALKEEMIKCDIVCANCHRNRTYERDPWYLWDQV